MLGRDRPGPRRGCHRAHRVAGAARSGAAAARTGGESATAEPREHDPSEREVPGNRRAETLVAALLVAAAVLGFTFTVLYVVLETNTQLLGLAMGGALGMLAAAAIVAGKMVVPQETVGGGTRRAARRARGTGGRADRRVRRRGDQPPRAADRRLRVGRRGHGHRGGRAAGIAGSPGAFPARLALDARDPARRRPEPPLRRR